MHNTDYESRYKVGTTTKPNMGRGRLAVGWIPTASWCGSEFRNPELHGALNLQTSKPMKTRTHTYHESMEVHNSNSSDIMAAEIPRTARITAPNK
jgi:hypothetical protein